MEIKPIKVKDGEVLAPLFGKGHNFLYKVIEEGEYVVYIYTNTFGEGTCSSTSFTKDDFANVKPCTEKEWNDALRASAKARIKVINDFVKEHSFNE